MWNPRRSGGVSDVESELSDARLALFRGLDATDLDDIVVVVVVERVVRERSRWPLDAAQQTHAQHRHRCHEGAEKQDDQGGAKAHSNYNVPMVGFRVNPLREVGSHENRLHGLPIAER